jgi:hypothetical protein
MLRPKFPPAKPDLPKISKKLQIRFKSIIDLSWRIPVLLLYQISTLSVNTAAKQSMLLLLFIS